MEKREVPLESLTNAKGVIDSLSIITGLPGSGKSYLMENAKFPEGEKVVDLDTVSSKKGDKWLADTAKVAGADIVVGWTDNLSDVANTLRESYQEGTPLTLYWIVPSLKIWQATQAAKARDYRREEGKQAESWAKSWDAKSKMTQKELDKLVSAKLKLLIAKISPEVLVIVNNSNAKGEIVNGWHGKKVEEAREGASSTSSEASDVASEGAVTTNASATADMGANSESETK